MPRAPFAFFFAALWLLPVAGRTQPAAAPAPEITLVEAQLRLNGTLGEIRELLARQLEGQSLALLLDRSRLAAEQAERIESRLSSARSEQRSLEDQRARLEGALANMSQRAEAARDESELARLESATEQLERDIQRLRGRSRDLAAEVGELESRLAAKREEAEGWQDTVDRRLAGL